MEDVIRHNLSGKIFVGDYAVRQYVDPLQSYRDVITVHKDEKEFIQSLCSVLRFFRKRNPKCWTGITEEQGEVTRNNVYLLWVNLEKLPFGKYWFQVQHVQFETTEIFLKVKMLRCYSEKEYNFNEKTYISMHKLQELLTLENIWKGIQFSAVLIMTFITFAANSLDFVADYSIRFIYALAALVESLTPILIATLNFWAKCIAGLYWLLLMMWRGNPNPQLRQYPVPSLQTTRRDIQYSPMILY